MKKIALSALVIAASGAYVWSQAGATDPLLAGADIQTGSIQPQTLAVSTGEARVAPREVPFVTHAAAPATAPSAGPAAPDLAAAAPADSMPPLPAPGQQDGFAPPSTATQTPPPSDPQSAPAAPVAVAAAEPAAAPVPDPASAPVATTTANIPMPRLRPPYRQVAAAAPTPAPASAPPSTSGPASPLTRIAANFTGLSDGTFAGPVVDAYYGLMQIEVVIQNGRLSTVHVLRYPNDRRTSIYINRQALPMLRDEVIQAQSANIDIVSGATLSSQAFIQSLGAALNKARA